MILGYPSTIGTGQPSGYPFDQLFTEVREVTPPQIMNGEVDALVIWGGSDISPTLYGEPASAHSQSYAVLSHRDQVETALFDAAHISGIPILGICRGAQLVCALSGGKLVQDVTGHHSNHAIRLKSGRSITTTSIHHQMMYPFGLEPEAYDLLAWSEAPLSSLYVMSDTDIRDTIEVEPEIIYFKNTNSLAIQGHPEFASLGSDFVQHVLSLTSKLLKGTL